MNRNRNSDSNQTKTARIPTTRYNPDYHKGLTSQQVQEHRLHLWVNKSVEPPSKTTREIIHDNTFTYFNLIFVVLALLLCITGSFRDLTFLPVIIANTLIGIVQEIRAKNTLDKMTMLHAPKATVVRDSKRSVIDAQELVIDDIVIFKAGDQVCADAEVCAGTVQVNESLLTGESDEVTKHRGDMLMSGSFIVSGQCHARLEKVGEDSYISKLTLQAKEGKNTESSEMIRSLNKIVKIVGIAIIPIGLILFGQAYFFQGESFASSIKAMVAAVIGMIPEGIFLLTSAALAVSSIRLAQNQVLLHDMKSIETLARVDVLCADKTGTITENDMKVQQVEETENYDPDTMPPLTLLIGDFAAAMSNDNITMEAVKAYFPTGTGKELISKTGFSSAYKYSSATFDDGTYVLGAPEFVLKDQYEDYEEKISDYASKGYRVLAFGTYQEEIDGKALKESILPLAFIMLANPIREGAKETFAYFKEQGVDVKVISGDNPVTVSEVAKQAGIEGADKYVDASDLHTEEEMSQAILNNTIFGRVTPNQKRTFVKLLKEAGKTVAMTGDGVNDVLALKDADCSIAMASGSDAAAQASQLVLLESDFSRMPEVVAEGRRVVNNIQRSASLFLVKNMFSFMLAVFSAVFFITYPLEPSQVSLIGIFTISIPGTVLALESNKNIIKGHFLTNVILKALPAALTDVIGVGALIIFGRTFGLTEPEISTASTILLAVVGFMLLYQVSKPMNRLRTAVMILCIAGLLFCVTFLSNLFAISELSVACIMLLVVFSFATEPLLRFLTLLIEKIRFYYLRLRGRADEND